MKLYQAVKICGEIASLGFDESLFADGTKETPSVDEVKKMVLAAQFVVDELFVDYGENIRKQKVAVVDNKVLLNAVGRVLKVTDSNGVAVPFRFVNGGVYVEDMREVCVTYTLIVNGFGWRDEIPTPSNVSAERVVVYGILSEYFLMSGDTAQAAVWRTRFEDCLANSGKCVSQKMPVRRWL